jgi:hypothetical protein
MSGDLGAPVNGEWSVRCIMASTRKVSADARQLCARNARTKYLLDYVAADARPDWQPYERTKSCAIMLPPLCSPQ